MLFGNNGDEDAINGIFSITGVVTGTGLWVHGTSIQAHVDSVFGAKVAA